MRLMLEMESTRSGWDDVFGAYATGEAAALLQPLLRAYGSPPAPDRIADLPSFAFGSPEPPPRFTPPGIADLRARLPSLIIPVEFEDPARGQAFIERIRQLDGRVGADPPIAISGAQWTPFDDTPPFFHTREAAELLIRADVPRAQGLRGQGVNLVLFDEGISGAALATRYAKLAHKSGQPMKFPGGWDVMETGKPPRLAGAAKPGSHGTMVALNALALAPEVRIFDLPMLPDRLTNAMAFTSFAAAALHWVQLEIELWLGKAFPGPWVFCHAWGVPDRRLERPWGGFTMNPGHSFQGPVKAIDSTLGWDQVFAAGNGGQFCPILNCGPDDIGPGKSIYGANSSPHVLTVGAVRADGNWIGYSAQGPGQAVFKTSAAQAMMEKPDLCAPSHFIEPNDAAWLSSGTSAACGIAAGAVAALRSTGSPLAGLSPEELRAHLRATAYKPAGSPAGYDIRMGHGILNLDNALPLSVQSAM